jgi:hypothetical protein
VHAVEFSRIGRTHNPATKTITQGNFTIIPTPNRLSNRHADLSGWDIPSYHHAEQVKTAGRKGMGPVRCLRGAVAFRLFAQPFGANK